MYNNSNPNPNLLLAAAYDSLYEKRMLENWNQKIQFIKGNKRHTIQVNEISIGLFVCADAFVQGYSICSVCVENESEPRKIKHKKYWVVEEEYSYNSINFDVIREKLKELNDRFNIPRVLTNIEALEKGCKDIINTIHYVSISNEDIQREAMATIIGFHSAGKLDIVENLKESLTNSFKIEKNNNANLRVNALFLAMYNYKFEEVSRS